VRVAINAVNTSTSPGGQTYLRNLIPLLARLDKSIRLVLFLNSREADSFRFAARNIEIKAIRLPMKTPFERLRWDQYEILRIMQNERFDILFSPGNGGPFLARVFGVRSVVSIQQDLPGLISVGFYPPLARLTRCAYMYFSILSCDKAIAVSKSLRDSIVKSFRCNPSNIVIIHHGGPSECFRPVRAVWRLKKVHEYIGSRNYILSVSNIVKYKNFANLVRAFALLVDQGGYAGSLCIVGNIVDRKAAAEIDIAANELGVSDRVRLLPFVGQHFLAAIYSSADLFVNPSLVESFGLTQLEAMACGVPVVVSNRSAMPEICGDAAAYFDPFDSRSIALVMNMVLRDQHLRNELIHRGLQHVRNFSWELAASKTLDVFYSVLGSRY